MPKFYKGYRIGSLEKEVLKLFLGVSCVDFSQKNIEIKDIFKTVRQKYEMPVVLKRLHNKKFITLKLRNGSLGAVITPKGKEYLRKSYLSLVVNKNNKSKKKYWDKKWHIVIFDIPERKRKIRNMLRFYLKRIGFIQIQGSVWIFPYECIELVALIKSNFKLQDEVLYITADSIEGENKLIKKFNLKTEN